MTTHIVDISHHISTVGKNLVDPSPLYFRTLVGTLALWPQHMTANHRLHMHGESQKKYHLQPHA